MIDVIAALEVAGDAHGLQDFSTTLSDLRTLYGIYTTAKSAKSFDVGALLQDKSTVAVVKRTADLFFALQNNINTAPHLAALLKSLSDPAPADETSTRGTPA